MLLFHMLLGALFSRFFWFLCCIRSQVFHSLCIFILFYCLLYNMSSLFDSLWNSIRSVRPEVDFYLDFCKDCCESTFKLASFADCLFFV